MVVEKNEGVSKFEFLMHPFNFLRIEWGLAETTFWVFQSNIRFSRARERRNTKNMT